MAKVINDQNKIRHYGIGIDSGGTFTDGVIIDLSNGTIIKTVKVRTTHHRLLTGIRNCLQQLAPDKTSIAALSLSTTLATNAVVEGKGADVGVFLIGQKAMGDIPTEHCFYIDGGHDSQGEPLAELDLATAEKYIEEVKDKVSAFAVSGMMSVRNPQHEKELKEFIMGRYGIPVICGHELTSTLGAHERAVTATLNARLIPVIKELIMAVKQTMEEEGIDAPLMLVRGDGSLVVAETALERPIETMLSGPAASIIGARYLTNLQNAVVADMGGTTTDTAVIYDGLPRVNPNGATVGGFLTRVKAVDIHTIGLGGDSHVQFHPKTGLKLGPQRVTPISVAARESETILRELKELAQSVFKSTRYQPVEFLFLSQKGRNHSALPANLKNFLSDGPHSILKIGQHLSTNPDLLALDQWMGLDLLSVVGLTPTDFKVAQGETDVGHRGAAQIALEITCRAFSLTETELYRIVMEKVDKMICATLMNEVMGTIPGFQESQSFLVEQIFANHQSKKSYDLSVKLHLPVIAVGAPVQAYYPSAMKALDSELVIPDHSDVANAVGAITGQVVETVELLIRPDAKGYTLYTPWEKISYPDGDLAIIKNDAEKMARTYVREQAEQNGGHNIEVYCDIEDVKTLSVLAAEERYFLECHVCAKALGVAYKVYLD